ncbi:MAG: hypothetical protein WCY83_07915, partial [Bacteroidales bacterium]
EVSQVFTRVRGLFHNIVANVGKGNKIWSTGAGCTKDRGEMKRGVRQIASFALFTKFIASLHQFSNALSIWLKILLL